MSIINEKIIFYNNCMADIESKENCLILKEEDIINGHLKTYKKEEENKVNQIVFYSSFNMTNDKATLIGLYEKYEYFHQNILQTFNDLKVLITCHFYNNNYSFLSTLKHLSIFKYENFNIFSNRFKIKINNDCKDHDMEKLKLFKEAINKKNNLKIEEYSVEDIHLKFSEVVIYSLFYPTILKIQNKIDKGKFMDNLKEEKKFFEKNEKIDMDFLLYQLQVLIKNIENKEYIANSIKEKYIQEIRKSIENKNFQFLDW
ncbi:hypothetical protein DICPUDRAFT_80398 [Dictyostelium purpureum]|uniref:Uncharacterized protein n=1 Tax=Dictyostelium purpureum TaxID=5786 RepID=F0ZQC8_DICPU|nr:uncharacterized protein DICPUDRAFT_80398 [Dictyostelium purpureum]EGC33884.1 hypothetical protein DICPUDRAFT_80398 [Dictyostelium purpureum]|eukprot:XP_003289622.1 hypothetical protein DICPUDRAFT_80398 [Dictyostelium purpureum]